MVLKNSPPPFSTALLNTLAKTLKFVATAFRVRRPLGRTTEQLVAAVLFAVELFAIELVTVVFEEAAVATFVAEEPSILRPESHDT